VTEPAVRGSNAARVRAAKGRRRLIINLGIVVVILAAAAVYWNFRRTRVQLPEGLVTGKVQRMDLVQAVSATGSVTAQTGAMVKIGSQITGRIKRLNADVGDKMKAGEVIAELAVPDLEAQVRQAQAALAVNQQVLAQQVAGVGLQDTQTRTDIQRTQAALGVARTNLQQVQQSAQLQVSTAQAGVRQAKANEVNSAANLKRTQELFEKGYVAAADVDNAQAQAEVNSAQLSSAQENLRLVETKVKADLPSAKDQVTQAQANLTAAQAGVTQNAIKRRQVAQAQEAVRQSEAGLAFTRAQLDKALIRTPISGTVLQLTQQQGETIAAGLSAPTLIIVADLSRLQVDAFVDETDIGRVALGQKAQVTVDAYPNRTFAGAVQKIASGATMQQNVVTYDVTIKLENPGGRLKPDMTATVNITVAKRENVLAVPVDAIKPAPRGATVTVMTRGKGQPEFRMQRVRTGVSDGEHTEITRGLREGQEVVLSGAVPGMGGQQMQRMRGPLGGPMGGPHGGGGRGGR